MLLVTIDFPGRREAASVAEMPLEPFDFQVHHLGTPRMPLTVDPREYSRRLLRRLPPGHQPVTGVLAYCLGASIGHEMAVLLAERQQSSPALVLLDGDAADAEAVIDAYDAAVRQLSGAAEGPGAVPRADIRALLSTGDDNLLSVLEESLRQLAEDALAVGPDSPAEIATIATDLAGRHLEFLAYVAAAARSSRPRFAGAVLRLISRGEPDPPEWPGAASTAIRRIDCDRDGMLANAQTATAIAAWLRHPAPDRPTASPSLSAADRTANTTDVRELCREAADILEVDAVEPEDDFFALGGDSLAAARFVGRLRKQLGLVVSIDDVFACPRLADLQDLLFRPSTGP